VRVHSVACYPDPRASLGIALSPRPAQPSPLSWGTQNKTKIATSTNPMKPAPNVSQKWDQGHQIYCKDMFNLNNITSDCNVVDSAQQLLKIIRCHQKLEGIYLQPSEFLTADLAWLSSVRLFLITICFRVSMPQFPIWWYLGETGGSKKKGSSIASWDILSTTEHNSSDG
jgi:hypothetical protein